MAHLANGYAMAWRLEEALSLHNKALDFRRGTLSSNHPEIGALASPSAQVHVLTFGAYAGKNMHCIATTYCLMGRRQEGLDLHKKAIEFLQRVLPPNHPTIGKTGAAHVLCDHDLMCGEQLCV